MIYLLTTNKRYVQENCRVSAFPDFTDPKAGLPFTITITQYTSTWFGGTFAGQVAGTNITTQAAHTATITNGKFKQPYANWSRGTAK
jgi:hypothetical protein